MASRNFEDVYKNILAIAPEDLAKDLQEKKPNWAPESMWDRLAEYVNLHIRPNSRDAVAIAIYSELCGVGYAEIKALFEGENC